MKNYSSHLDYTEDKSELLTNSLKGNHFPISETKNSSLIKTLLINSEDNLNEDDDSYIIEMTEDMSTNSQLTLMNPPSHMENYYLKIDQEEFIDINQLTENYNLDPKNFRDLSKDLKDSKDNKHYQYLVDSDQEDYFDINKIKEEVTTKYNSKKIKKKLLLNSEKVKFIIDKFPQYSNLSENQIRKYCTKTRNKFSFIIHSEKNSENNNYYNKISFSNSNELFSTDFLLISICIREKILKPDEDFINNILIKAYQDDYRCLSYKFKFDLLIIKCGGIKSRLKNIVEIYKDILDYFKKENYMVELSFSTYIHFEDIYSEIKNLSPQNFRNKFPNNYTIDINKRISFIKKLRNCLYDN